MKTPTQEQSRGFKGCCNTRNLPDHGLRCNVKASLKRDLIRRDAKVLQLLKLECQRTGRGEVTLQEVFKGLLSVHNRNLIPFAEALQREGKNE